MKAIRPLIYMVVALLVVTFIFENNWMFEDRTITYNLLFWEVGKSPPFPIWGMVLMAFALGYLMAWTIGRLDIWSARRQNGKLKKRATAAEAERDNLQGRLHEATAPTAASSVPATTTPASKPAHGAQSYPAEAAAAKAEPAKIEPTSSESPAATPTAEAEPKDEAEKS